MIKTIPSIIWQPDTITTDFDRLFQYALLWGFDGLELRYAGSRTERVPNLREPALLRRLKDTGLTVGASDPGLFEDSAEDRVGLLNELEMLKEVLSFNHRMGIRSTIVGAFNADSPVGSVTSLLGYYKSALDLCRPLGQRLLVRSAEAIEIVQGLQDSTCQAVWEPSTEEHIVDGDRFAPHIGLVRFKVNLTAAELDRRIIDLQKLWAALLEPLARSGFSGDICLELHTEKSGQVGLAVSTALIKTVKRAFST